MPDNYAVPGCHREFGDEWVEYHHRPAGAARPEAPAGVAAPKPQPPRVRITSWGVLVLLLTLALYGCGGGGGGQTPTQTPPTQEPTTAPTPPPPPPATQLFLGGDIAADGCGPLPAGARGSLCPGSASPIRANVTIRHFIFDSSPGEWRGTLTAPLTGSGYRVVVPLAMAPGMTATGQFEILLRKAGVDTVLFGSADLTVASDTYQKFEVTGAGSAATGAPGDELIIRIKCKNGCKTNGLGVLLVNNPAAPVPAAFIEVPPTALR